MGYSMADQLGDRARVLLAREAPVETNRDGFAAKVLVVEDNRTVTRMLEFSLREAGFDIVEARSGRQALDILEHAPIDAVVLDLSLPDDLGQAVLERLHHMDHRPVWVVMSALDRKEAIQEYGPLDGAFLVKPFDPWELVKLLEELLKAKREEA